MYIISEVLYAEIPQKREGKSVTIAGWKNPPVQLSAFSPWPSTGEDVYTTSGNYELSFVIFYTTPPLVFNTVVPTSLSSLRARVLSNVEFR